MFSFAWFIFVVFILVFWLWLLISVIGDLFRRDDVGGVGKVLWIILLILLPYIGVFAYLLTQSGGMGDRSTAQLRRTQRDLREFVGFSLADELKKLDELKTAGSITAEEHKRLHANLLG